MIINPSYYNEIVSMSSSSIRDHSENVTEWGYFPTENELDITMHTLCIQNIQVL